MRISAALLLALLTPLSFGCAHAVPSHGPQAALVAERSVWCGPGWVLTAFPDGRLIQHVSDTCLQPHETRRAIRVDPRDVSDLLRLASEVGFFTLPSSIEAETYVTDEDHLHITAWLNGAEHTVSARGLERLSSSNDEARRFLILWAAVNELVATAGR